MEIFHFITFVMNKSTKGEYVRRVRCSSQEKEYQNVKFGINSLLDKLEGTLTDIEMTVKKFLALSPNHQPDLLLEAVLWTLWYLSNLTVRSNLGEDKEQVYHRIEFYFTTRYRTERFCTHRIRRKNDIHPNIVFDASSQKRSINLNCRALRTKQTVTSDQFRDICGLCNTSASHLCIPYLISSDSSYF